MDFSWGEEQREFRDAIIRFAQKELKSNVAEQDQKGEFDLEGWRKCGKLGIQGLPIPKEYGGSQADVLTTVYCLEGLGFGCKDNGLIFSIHAHMWTCAIPIWVFGTEEQKRKYLPGLCSGELIGGNAMSEPNSGSDAYGLRTTAEKNGDKYLLSGSKVFVTNGPIANVLVVFASVDRSKKTQGITAFIVEKGFPGFSVSHKAQKMGLRTSPMAELFLDQCEVPEENRLGREGAGVAVFTHSMEWERSCILASAIGAMERQLQACIQYAKDRQQFGKPIGKFQLVSSKLVDMKLRLETARALLYNVAWLRKCGKFALMEAAMAKLYISECWVQSCMDAIQIHGGYGYLADYGFEREMRDALGSRLYSGTSEIQRQVVAQFMGL